MHKRKSRVRQRDSAYVGGAALWRAIVARGVKGNMRDGGAHGGGAAHITDADVVHAHHIQCTHNFLATDEHCSNLCQLRTCGNKHTARELSRSRL